MKPSEANIMNAEGRDAPKEDDTTTAPTHHDWTWVWWALTETHARRHPQSQSSDLCACAQTNRVSKALEQLAVLRPPQLQRCLRRPHFALIRV